MLRKAERQARRSLFAEPTTAVARALATPQRSATHAPHIAHDPMEEDERPRPPSLHEGSEDEADIASRADVRALLPRRRTLHPFADGDDDGEEGTRAAGRCCRPGAW